jgi:hypothetical protein
MRGGGSGRGDIGCVRKRGSRSLSELKLRPPENRDSFHGPIWRSVTALGGAFDLDCCAVDQDFGDALHQLV